MDLTKYQRECLKTDQTPGTKGLGVALLGLAGEAGSLLTEYKKRLREGRAYKLYEERIAEELGDILWYVANISSRANLDLSDIALKNLEKVRSRWTIGDDQRLPQRRLFDEGDSPKEQLPRTFRMEFKESRSGTSRHVRVFLNGDQIGDQLTDNAYEDDGYRYHDVFHFAYAAVLGWSPVTRANLKRKRKSKPRTDEVEDGGRAIAIEEGISAVVFKYASEHSFFNGVEHVDSEILRMISGLTSNLEVRNCSSNEWQNAILQGYAAWRPLKQKGKGVIVGNLLNRTIRFVDSRGR